MCRNSQQKLGLQLCIYSLFSKIKITLRKKSELKKMDEKIFYEHKNVRVTKK